MRFLVPLLPYALLFLLVQTLLRISLYVRGLLEVEFTHQETFQLFLRGAWFDLITLSFFMVVIAFLQWLLPLGRRSRQTRRVVAAAGRFVFCYILLFDAVAEHLFWSEFSTRFNFIAVDYLIYTQEVIGNIAESYSLPLLLGVMALASAFVSWLSLRLLPADIENTRSFSKRSLALAGCVFFCVSSYNVAKLEQASVGDHAIASELAANGMYNFFYAFGHNEISYSRFYKSEPQDTVRSYARRLLQEKDQPFASNDPADLTRIVKNPKPERHKNVMLVVMESMSADYMGTFGSDAGLTPNLDRLAREGLLFSDLYATGTRTVRGLEAVTLSIPPTPGQSIIRRPDNHNLFSLGFIFRDRGYDTRFIYGGYGYFDNMNDFFSGNGFDIIDRASMAANEIEFANVWGICDEDMFRRAIAEADRSHASGKPFLNLIMTTSNHRPYTYPEGRIDIPSKSGRFGGVKYADYSVGKLIEWAKEKPWFDDTIFVFVADHTAGAAGKSDLNPRKYHIPLIYYAPSMIAPQRYEKTASQIDTAPVLLGFLNFSYYTKFYGEDVIGDADETPRAFISNFQKVALIKDQKLVVLSPKSKVDEFEWPRAEVRSAGDAQLEDAAIAYYQSASWWRDAYRRIPTTLQSHTKN